MVNKKLNMLLTSSPFPISPKKQIFFEEGGEKIQIAYTHCQNEVDETLKDAKKVLFIPYARHGGMSHEDYYNMTKPYWDYRARKEIKLISKNPHKDIENAEAIFVAGGNSFMLLKQLQNLGLVNLLREKISSGTPYMSTSAGTNITGLGIHTTNDMPIVFPSQGLDALGIIPCHINPHYSINQNKVGERETTNQRLEEFLKMGANENGVLCLPEDSSLRVKNGDIIALDTIIHYKTSIKEPIKYNNNIIL